MDDPYERVARLLHELREAPRYERLEQDANALAAVLADARRYRWLRDEATLASDNVCICYLTANDRWMPVLHDCVDATIDRAMQAAGETP